jgi:hypothetical protein
LCSFRSVPSDSRPFNFRRVPGASNPSAKHPSTACFTFPVTFHGPWLPRFLFTTAAYPPSSYARRINRTASDVRPKAWARSSSTKSSFANNTNSRLRDAVSPFA